MLKPAVSLAFRLESLGWRIYVQHRLIFLAGLIGVQQGVCGWRIFFITLHGCFKMGTELKPSNYTFRYEPVKPNGLGRHNVYIAVRKEFCDFAREQKVNIKQFERIAYEVRICNKWDKLLADSQKRDGFCRWDGGLLKRLVIPGDAARLVLDMDDTINGPMYKSYNIDGASQASLIFAIMAFYFEIIESEIPK